VCNRFRLLRTRSRPVDHGGFQQQQQQQRRCGGRRFQAHGFRGLRVQVRVETVHVHVVVVDRQRREFRPQVQIGLDRSTFGKAEQTVRKQRADTGVFRVNNIRQKSDVFRSRPFETTFVLIGLVSAYCYVRFTIIDFGR